MSREETALWFAKHVNWEPSYYLSSIPVHIVVRDHWLARHHDELPADEVVTVEQQHEPELWRKIADADRRNGKPPTKALVITSAPEHQ